MSKVQGRAMQHEFDHIPFFSYTVLFQQIDKMGDNIYFLKIWCIYFYYIHKILKINAAPDGRMAACTEAGTHVSGSSGGEGSSSGDGRGLG